MDILSATDLRFIARYKCKRCGKSRVDVICEDCISKVNTAECMFCNKQLGSLELQYIKKVE